MANERRSTRDFLVAVKQGGPRSTRDFVIAVHGATERRTTTDFTVAVLVDYVPPSTPTVLSVTNITQTGALVTGSAYHHNDAIPQQNRQFRIRRLGSSIILHTATLGAVTSYTIPDGTLIPGRQFQVSIRDRDTDNQFSQWSAWFTFTTEDDELADMCNAIPAWRSVAQYMEPIWEPGWWYCVGLLCNAGSALYGAPFDQGLPIQAFVQKYEMHPGHDPDDPTTWIPIARKTSTRVRGRVALGALSDGLFHDWAGQIDGFYGLCMVASDDQGGNYGVAVGYRVGEINQGLGPCSGIGGATSAAIELYIFEPGGPTTPAPIGIGIGNYFQIRGRMLTCGGVSCFRPIEPIDIDAEWIHQGGTDYYYRVEILGAVLEGTVTTVQAIPAGYDGLSLAAPGGGEGLFAEFAAPPGPGRPCELILQCFEDDRETIAWEVGTNPAHAHPFLCLPENYGEQEIDIVVGAATIAQIEAIVIDKPQMPGDQDSGWLTQRISQVHGHRFRMVRFIDQTQGWVVLADGPAGTPRLDESLSAFRWVIRDTRETERKVRAFLEASETTSVWPSGLFGSAFGPAEVVDPIVGNYVGNGYGVGVDWFSEWSDFPFSDPLPVVPVYLAIKSAAEKMLTSEIEQVSFFGSIAGPLWRHRWPSLKFAWRPVGSTNPFTVIGAEVILPYNTSFTLASVFDAQLADGTEVRAIYKLYTPWWALDATPPEPNEPPDGDIEVHLIYRGPPTANTPYHIEDITAGQFLSNLYDGVYSPPDINGDPIPTGIRYDPAAMLQMTDLIRLRQTEPVDDVRDWAEKYVYGPDGWVAALDNDGNISPVSQIPPPAGTALTLIHNEITEPTPDWNAGERVVSYLVFKYPRLYVPATTGLEVEALDGILIQQVVLEFRDEASISEHGEQKIEYDGRCFAAVGDPGGSSTGGGTPSGFTPLDPPTPDGSTLDINGIVVLEWINAYTDAEIQVWVADGSQWPSDTPGSGFASEQPPTTTQYNTGKAPYELLTPTYAAIRHRRGTDYSIWVFFQGSPGFD